LSVDNGWPEDKCKTTEERLKFYGFDDPRLKVIHFPKRKDYARFLKKGHVFLSCSRGEGWNLPLIEAMACGTPSIYSKCSAQMEYAEGKGHPVNVVGETKCPTNVGNYYEPDFDHLSNVMRDVYKNYKKYKEKAIKDSVELREKFNWDNPAKFASERIEIVHKNYYNKKMKILFIAPHLSTGGCPQYLLKKIKVMNEDHDVYCIEYANYGIYAVQRNQVKEILKEKFFELPENKDELNNIIDRIKPDVVHLEEMPEYFMDQVAKERLYRTNRPYVLIETSHDSSFDPNKKTVLPDKLMLVSEYQKNNLKPLNIPMEVHEYPIVIKPRKTREEALKVLGLDPNKKHVLHVGLFTPRKNQAEIVEYAKRLQHYPIQFHFVGNQAPNFKHYWEPIMKDFPSNCVWWNERKDVDNFYQAADLFLFVSREYPGDKETSPLVIREAISNNIPSLIHNIPVYMGMYDKYKNIKYLDTDDKDSNINKILSMLEIKSSSGKFYTKNGEKDLGMYDYVNNMSKNIDRYGEEAGMYWATFIFKELEKFNVDIKPGDVFVDLGANIGISSRYADLKGAKEIYAFEPDPVIGEIYRKNIPSAKLFQYAIDSTKKNIELYYWPFNDRDRGPKYNIETATLKDVLRLVGKPIDYLKIDVEGFEENIFDDLTYEECSKIKKVFLEHHNPEKTNELAERLKKKGYELDIEWGNGQNYIYAIHSGDNKVINRFFVQYDKTDNKITFRSKRSYDNLLVSIKELDSNAVIWSSKYDRYHKDCYYWIIPAPKSYIDFDTSPIFGGVLVEFYSNGELVSREEIRIRPTLKDKPKLLSVNITEPTYVNYTEFFIDKVYNKYLEGKSFNTVVDVGANIGLWTEYIKHTSKCKKIYAVEPNTTALKVLKETFINDNSVIVVDKAMANIDGELEFFVDEQNSTISSLSSFGSLKKSYKVKSTTLKTFLKEYNVRNIDLFKVDIETGEYDLFESFGEFEFSKIDNILVEYHLTNGKTLDGDVKRLSDTLEKFGYEIDVRNMHGLGGFIFANKKEKYSKETRLESLLKEYRMDYITHDCNGVNLLHGLHDLIKQNVKENFKMAEVGSFIGRSTELFAMYCEEVYSIDPYLSYSEVGNEHMSTAESKFLEMAKNYSNIKQIKKTSFEASKDFEDKSLDLVYIDAAHDYQSVKNDILTWAPKVKVGGYLCGHDYVNDQILKAVKELYPNEKILTYSDSSWCIKIKKEVKEIFIVSAYPDVEEKEELLNKTVTRLKSLGKTVLLASHYAVPNYIVEKVDYYIYDSYNMINTEHVLEKDGADYWMDNSNFKLQSIVTAHTSALSRMFGLAINFVKSLGYDYFVILESDSDYDLGDLKKFDDIKNDVIENDKKLFFFKPKKTEFCWFDSFVYETYCFGGFVSEFDKRFKFPTTINEWNNLYNEDRKINCMEYLIYKNFSTDEKDYHILGTLRSYFLNSKIDLFSFGDPIGIYYNEKDEMKPVIFLLNQGNYKKTYYISCSSYIGLRKMEINPGCWWLDCIDISTYDLDVYIWVEENGKTTKRFKQNINKESVKKLKSYKVITFK